MWLILTNCILMDGGFDGVWGDNEVPKVIDNHTLARPFVQKQELASLCDHILQAAGAFQVWRITMLLLKREVCCTVTRDTSALACHPVTLGSIHTVRGHLPCVHLHPMSKP